MNDNQNLHEDEIDLRELINVIVKRKKFILGLFFASVVITAVISFLTPKVYQLSMVLESPTTGITDQGLVIRCVDSLEDIMSSIDSHIFDKNIEKALNLYPQTGTFNFNTSKESSSLIKIVIEKQEKDIKLGVNILNQLFIELSNKYKNIIEHIKNNIDQQILGLSYDMKTINNKKDMVGRQLDILEQRKESLIEEIDKVKVNTEKIIAERGILLNSENRADNKSSLLYSNIIQQNIAYYNQLQTSLTNVIIEKENIKTDILNQDNAVSEIKNQITQLNASKNNVNNVVLIIEPQRSRFPIKPNKKLKVTIAGIFSLMLGIFLAFFMEFWQKSNLKTP